MPLTVSESIDKLGTEVIDGVPELLEIVAEEIANRARRNARAKGGRRFWVHDILNSIHSEEDGELGYVVGSTHIAAAHKQFGGRISAPGMGEGSLHRKFLTIPVGEAKQKGWDTDKAKAAGIELTPITTKKGRRFLIGGKPSKRKNASSKAKRSGKKKASSKLKNNILFVLKQSVDQPAEPWFPWGSELGPLVKRGIDLYLRTKE